MLSAHRGGHQSTAATPVGPERLGGVVRTLSFAKPADRAAPSRLGGTNISAAIRILPAHVKRLVRMNGPNRVGMPRTELAGSA